MEGDWADAGERAGGKIVHASMPMRASCRGSGPHQLATIHSHRLQGTALPLWRRSTHQEVIPSPPLSAQPQTAARSSDDQPDEQLTIAPLCICASALRICSETFDLA